MLDALKHATVTGDSSSELSAAGIIHRQGLEERAPQSLKVSYSDATYIRFGGNYQALQLAGTHMTCGAVPSVVHRWWLSSGSLLARSNFAPHRCSLLPHETTLSSPNPSRVSACSISLRLNAEQNSFSRLLSAGSAILSCRSQLSPSAAVLSRTVSATLYTPVSYLSISIGPASAATTGGLLLTP